MINQQPSSAECFPEFPSASSDTIVSSMLHSAISFDYHRSNGNSDGCLLCAELILCDLIILVRQLPESLSRHYALIRLFAPSFSELLREMASAKAVHLSSKKQNLSSGTNNRGWGDLLVAFEGVCLSVQELDIHDCTLAQHKPLACPLCQQGIHRNS